MIAFVPQTGLGVAAGQMIPRRREFIPLVGAVETKREVEITVDPESFDTDAWYTIEIEEHGVIARYLDQKPERLSDGRVIFNLR